MQRIYKVVKEISLITAGALLGLLPNYIFLQYPITNDPFYIIIAIVIFLPIGFGVFDSIGKYIKKLVRFVNYKYKRIALLNPFEISPTNSSWVGVSTTDISSYIQQHSNFKIKIIKRISRDTFYPVIINPYGGAYPEENISELTTFNSIISYVREGGIFVNIADIPFYYGFDDNLARKVDTTPLANIPFNIPIRSFFHTLLSEKLKCTIVGTEPVINESGVVIARLFANEPAYTNLYVKSFPLSLSNIAVVDGTPIIKIPYGKGYFIFSTIEIMSTNLSILDYIVKGITDSY